jgi:hypothetical protein
LAKHTGYRKKHTAREKLGSIRKHKGTSGKTCDIKIKEYMCGGHMETTIKEDLTEGL